MWLDKGSNTNDRIQIGGKKGGDTETLDSIYVKKSGDTMDGKLYLHKGLDSYEDVMTRTGILIEIDNSHSFHIDYDGRLYRAQDGDLATSIGYDSTAKGIHSVSLGMTATAPGGNSISIGQTSVAGSDSTDYAIAIGDTAKATGAQSIAIGRQTTASSQFAIALGDDAVASASGAVQIGSGTNSTANTLKFRDWVLVDANGMINESRLPSIGVIDLVEIEHGGTGNKDGYIRTGQKSETTAGENSTIEGTGNTVTGQNSHAEGAANIVSGTEAHAEGYGNSATGTKSHAEGESNQASGDYAHVEGTSCIARGAFSHAGGSKCNALAAGSFSFGASNIANGFYDNIIGGVNNQTISTNSPGEPPLADEDITNANTILGGAGNILSGLCCVAMGTCNNSNATSKKNTFYIGSGQIEDSGRPIQKQNCFRAGPDGVYGSKAYATAGADYAEFVKEWADKNPNNEDRVGYFVTVKEDGLHKATSTDYILGITSGAPSVVGNADEDYFWKFQRDIFNRPIYDEVPEKFPQWDEESQSTKMVETGRTTKVNRLSPDYDPSRQSTYVERKDRPEWDYVGMLGVIPVRDDGTCQAGGFCKCADGGIATAADSGYFVIERKGENVVSVMFR